MADLTVGLQVLNATTQSLILDFTPANGYDVVDIGEGGRTFRRQTATSDWVPGRMLLSTVLDAAIASVIVRCRASSQSALWTLIDAARAAMETAPDYILAVTLGSRTEKWLCEPADSALGSSSRVSSLIGSTQASYDPFEFVAIRQTLYFSVPRSPILVA